MGNVQWPPFPFVWWRTNNGRSAAGASPATPVSPSSSTAASPVPFLTFAFALFALLTFSFALTFPFLNRVSVFVFRGINWCVWIDLLTSFAKLATTLPLPHPTNVPSDSPLGVHDQLPNWSLSAVIHVPASFSILVKQSGVRSWKVRITTNQSAGLLLFIIFSHYFLNHIFLQLSIQCFSVQPRG